MTTRIETEDVVEAVAEVIYDFLDARFPEDAMPGGQQLFATDHLDADFQHEAGCEELARAIVAATPIERLREENARPVVTELDANGEAMMCEGCGTTKTIAAILAQHGPKAIACCPERKMVEARHFWRAALTPSADDDK